MRKTLSLLAIIAALSTTAFAESSASFSGGEDYETLYEGADPDYSVTISEGGATTVQFVYGKYEESGEGSASGSKVVMTGGALDAFAIIGGYAWDDESTANDNTVFISGGQLDHCHIVAGSSFGEGGDANGNTVIITGGEFMGGSIFAAEAKDELHDNTLTISGGSFTENVDVRSYSSSSSAAPHTGNTINLVGKGGELYVESIDETLQGHELNIPSITLTDSLNIYGKGITVGTITFGGDVNFYLAPDTQNGDTILTMAGTDFFTGDPVDNGMFFVMQVNVRCDGATLLENGDTVTLVHNGPDGYTLVAEKTEVDIIKGVTAEYEGKVVKVGNDLVLQVGTADTNDEALKSMTETRTDVAALVNAAADFMATTGVQQAKLAAKVAALTSKDGVAPFVALGGSSMRYNTGSHVDADGFNGALGVAKAFDDITLGLAGEYGLSSYKSYVGSTNAKGDSKLYGGALLADWQDKQGWHAEGAVRLGRTSTDYSAMTALGHTHYTDHASYQGIMLGGGKEVKVSKKSDDTIDLYARYFYSHTNASNTTATSGEGMHFSGVNSHRTMVGARYNHELCDTAVLYAGAAWMHEFDGDAHSVIGGFTSPSPSLEGDSGMVEIGTTFAPCSSESILLNLNLQGWTGVQRGISGGAGCTIKF